MQIAPQSSLPSGGPDSIKNLQPPGALLLGGENAGQITVTLSAGSKTLAPYWWSETAHAWVAAPNSYQLSATAPTATGTFSKVAEPQFWALLATGGGTVTYCDLDSTTTTSSGEGVPTSRTISVGGALTGGGNLSANRTISLAALDPSPAASFTKGVIKELDAYGRVVEAEEDSSDAPVAQALLRTLFVTGGGINPFKIRPVIYGTVTYSPYFVSTAVTDDDTKLVYSITGGVFPVRIEYDSNVDLTITIRKCAADGTWSTASTVTAALADTVKEFNVTLAAEEGFDLHCAASGGGVITFLYFRVYY